MATPLQFFPKKHRLRWTKPTIRAVKNYIGCISLLGAHRSPHIWRIYYRWIIKLPVESLGPGNGTPRLDSWEYLWVALECCRVFLNSIRKNKITLHPPRLSQALILYIKKCDCVSLSIVICATIKLKQGV